MALYQSTDGPNWTDNTGWRDADPNILQSVQGWKGLALTSWDQVNRIDLANNNLRGVIPENISNLSGLAVLGLANNQISGSLPQPSGIWYT